MDFTFDPLFLSIVLGSVLPILVGLVTQRVAHPGLKATLLAALSTATGVFAAAQNEGGLVRKETLYFAAAAWATAVATHYGLLKPTGTSEKVADVAPNAGLKLPSDG